MKVLAAGKSIRPAPASAPRYGPSGNVGHLAIASGTPTRCRHTDTWGARAAGQAAGGSGWRPGASAEQASREGLGAGGFLHGSVTPGACWLRTYMGTTEHWKAAPCV